MFAFASPAALRTRATAPSLRPAVCPLAARAPSRAANAPSMVLYDRDTKTSSGASQPTPIRITGNNIHLTDALRRHINDKLGKVLRRFVGVISKMDVHLTVDHNPSIPNRYKAEVIAFAGRTILRTETRLDDMYAAVDAAEERIARTIRKFKERRISRSDKIRAGEVANPALSPLDVVDDDDDAAAAAAEQDDFRDVFHDKIPGVPAVTDVVRKKVFPMPLQTVEEAVLCCEYVDHPWYLFRNAETKEISLVYKRNHGGYGLIEPSNPNSVDGEAV